MCLVSSPSATVHASCSRMLAFCRLVWRPLSRLPCTPARWPVISLIAKMPRVSLERKGLKKKQRKEMVFRDHSLGAGGAHCSGTLSVAGSSQWTQLGTPRVHTHMANSDTTLRGCSVARSYPTLRSNGPQHARFPCPSLSPGVCWNSYPLSWWLHPTISSSVVPFSSCPQSFPASGSFLINRLFSSGDQSIRASASNIQDIQDWFPLGWTGFISLLSKGLSSNTSWKHEFCAQPPLWSNFHIRTWLLEKP